MIERILLPSPLHRLRRSRLARRLLPCVLGGLSFSSGLAPASPPAGGVTFGVPRGLSAEEPGPLGTPGRRPPQAASGAGDQSSESAVIPAPPRPAQVIDLPQALSLAGVENPTIGLAQETVRASEADLLRARALLFPTLAAGGNLRVHRGNLLSARGVVRDVNSQSLYLGAGADAKGTGTVAVPGVRLIGHLADALYAPQAAGQRVTSRGFDAVGTRNAILLQVALQYLALAGAEAQLQAIRQTESELGEVARITASFAATGQGRASDADRARTSLLLLRGEDQRAQEALGVITAQLARLLGTDAAIQLRTAEGTPPLIELVDLQQSLDCLLRLALTRHPEIGARSADVVVNEIQLRQERARPFLPLLSVGFSAGDFGGGSNLVGTRLGQFGGRTDFDVLAIWSLQNLGVGNRAIQHRTQAEVGEALAERARVVDRVRREVSEAYGLALARRQAMEVARRRVETALRAYQQDLTRTRNLQGRPIEVLNSINLLQAARQNLIQALVGYSQAQVQLFVAMGQTPTPDGLSCNAAP